MSKTWLFLAFGTLSSIASAGPRLGTGAMPIFQDSGDTASAFAVNVGTTTPVKIYTSDRRHREVLIQNTSEDYKVYLGTHSAVSATSGSRAVIPTFPTAFVTNGIADIWAIAESAAGADGVDVVGWIEYDSRDLQ